MFYNKFMSEIGEISELTSEKSKQKPVVVQPNAESPTAERKVENGNEPIRPETIDEICNLMQRLPRMGEAFAFEIPYRTELQALTQGVLDEETGLYVEAAYNPGPNKISAFRPVQGLTIVLSTPSLHEDEDVSANLDKMAYALRTIYGESPNLEEEIETVSSIAISNNQYDRVKFELLTNQSEAVLNGFQATSGKERPAVGWWEKAPRRPVSESGGLFLKDILERATQKQIEEAEKNKLLTKLAVEKVKDEAVPNDDSRVHEYAYHATRHSNIPSISELGLRPSGSESKEPGTIFFTEWDFATTYQPEGAGGEGVIYRFRVEDIPEIAKAWHYDSKEGTRGFTSYATDQPIPPERLDFSLDSGKTWMPVVSHIKQAA